MITSLFLDNFKSLIKLRDPENKLITHHLRRDSPRIEEVEVSGLVLSVDNKTKTDSFLLCDGTSSISCLTWKSSQIEQPIKGKMILVRGEISIDFDQEYIIILKSWNYFSSIKDEVMWFSHCAYLHRFIYPNIFSTTSTTKIPKPLQHQAMHWDKARIFLGSSFSMKDLIKVLNDKWNLQNCDYDSIILEWIKEGLVFRDPLKQFYILDDNTNRESLYHIVNNIRKRESKHSSPHPMYIWNCLKQLGYLLSPKLV